MNQAIISEIINDLIKIDPKFKNIKPELEKLVQEIISNKPETPFTQEFKKALKKQIIGTINEQKILHNEKIRNRSEILHSLKFWLVGISTITAGLLVFVMFQYFDNITQPGTQITYIQKIGTPKETPTETTLKGQFKPKQNLEPEINGVENDIPNNNIMTMLISKEPQKSDETPEANDEITCTEEGMIQLLDTSSEDNINQFPDTTDSPIMARSFIMPVDENTDLAIAESTLSQNTATPSSPTFCETSSQFLTKYNLSPTSENTTKMLIYNNQIYKADINFTNNSININHIGTQDDTQTETELPNLNLFFDNNKFNIKQDYKDAIIEETNTIINYYYPNNNQENGITAQIDKNTNIIFSIQNICIYQ